MLMRSTGPSMRCMRSAAEWAGNSASRVKLDAEPRLAWRSVCLGASMNGNVAWVSLRGGHFGSPFNTRPAVSDDRMSCGTACDDRA